MKVRALGGVHPDEREALEFVKGLHRDRIANVTPRIANLRARALGKRAVHQNFAGSVPGDPGPKVPRLDRTAPYEPARGAEVTMQGRLYDSTVDFHGLINYGIRHGQIDRQQGISRPVLGALAGMGMNKLVRTNYGGVMRYSPDTAVAEFQKEDYRNSSGQIRDALDALANDENPPTATAADFEWFDLLDYSPHVDELGPEVLEGYDIEPFQPLPEEIVARMGHPAGLGQVCLIGWSDEPNDRGYWTDLVTPMSEAPDDTNWPGQPIAPPYQDRFSLSHTWQQG